MHRVLAIIGLCLASVACSRDASTSAQQAAQPPEPVNQTYKSLDGDIVAIISADELELRDGGDNYVCKYTRQDGKLRVIVNVLGTTTALYFETTPQGLVDEDGEIYYTPTAYARALEHQRLNEELANAAQGGNAAEVERLLGAGADVDARQYAITSLGLAVLGGHTNVVKVLLEHKADPNREVVEKYDALNGFVPEKRTRTVSLLTKAATSNHEGIVTLLLDHGATIGTEEGNESALWIALQGGYTNIVRALLQHKANPNQLVSIPSGWGTRQVPFLMPVVEAANIGLAALLLEHGADPNQGDSGSLLWKAIEDGDEAMLRLLLKHGANPSAARSDGFSPLMSAVRNQENAQILEMLCEAGANVNAQDGEGDTALIHGIKAGKMSHVTILLSAGADRSIANKRGETAYSLAERHSHVLDAIRTPEERDAHNRRVSTYSTLVLGTWRFENGVSTYRGDGTVIHKWDDGDVAKADWQIAGETLTRTMRVRNGTPVKRPEQYVGSIVDITDDSFAYREGDVHRVRVWRATRVPQPGNTLDVPSNDELARNLVGKEIELLEDNSRALLRRWTFGADDPVQIRVIDNDIAPDSASVTAEVVTAGKYGARIYDGSGRVRMKFERLGSEWLLFGLENVSFRVARRVRE